MIFVGAFCAAMLTYGMQSPGEELSPRDLMITFGCFLIIPLVGLIMTIKNMTKSGYIISALSPFASFALDILI